MKTTDTTSELIIMRTAEQMRLRDEPERKTAARRMLINALEIAIVMSGECDKIDEIPLQER